MNKTLSHLFQKGFQFAHAIRSPRGTELAQRWLSTAKSKSSNTSQGSSQFFPKADKTVGYWFLSISAATFGIVVVGGITRLTESGLSITEWNVIKGMKWPSSEKEWKHEFDLYKNTPEYIRLHHHMDLQEFKNIFYWEWLHRMLGRGIGLLVTFPAIYFAYTRKLPATALSSGKKHFMDKATRKRALWMIPLVGLQGVIGWYMVKSGLTVSDSEHPRVSPYRLSLHYGTAVTLFSMALWSGMDILHSHSPLAKSTKPILSSTVLRSLSKTSHIATALVFFTSIAGALVAGNDAGMVYNTWPLMGDRFIPPTSDLLALPLKEQEGSKWLNFFENDTMVQFQHRMMAYMTSASVATVWLQVFRLGKTPLLLPAHLLLGTTGLQVLLGITTVLYMVPISAAAGHQASSIALMASSLFLMNRVRFLKKLPCMTKAARVVSSN